MEITTHQIAAAIRLAGLHESEFAERASLTKATLSNFLNGKTGIRSETMDRIVKTLNGLGVEFGPREGVAKRDDTIRRLEGQNAYLELLDEIYHKLKGTSEEALFLCVDDAKSSPDVTATNNRIRDAGISCRYVCREDPEKLDYPRKDYRSLPARFYSNDPQVIFGDYVASVLLTPELNILLVRNKGLADTQRQLFEFIWSNTSMPKAPA